MLFLLMLGMGHLPASATSAFSGPGSGTKEDPYQIYDALQLYEVRYCDYLSYFKIMNDIDLTDFIAENFPDEGWEPITVGVRVNGNNKKITGLTINRPKNRTQGLFGYVTSLEIKDLTIEGNIVGQDYVGMFAGGSATLTNCRAIGSVKGRDYVGGLLCGCRWGGNIVTSCVNEATVVGRSFVGGILGDTSDNLSKCQNIGDVTGTGNYVGGITGYSTKTISQCSSNGKVEGANHVGGIVGYGNKTYSGHTINNNSFCGVVRGNTRVGGIAGFSDNVISYCHAKGIIVGKDSVGGIIGPCNIGVVRSMFVGGTILSTKGEHVRRIGGDPDNYCLVSMTAMVAAQGEKPTSLDGKSTSDVMFIQKSTWAGNNWDLDDTWTFGHGAPPYQPWQTRTLIIRETPKAGDTSIRYGTADNVMLPSGSVVYARVGDKVYSQAGGYTIEVPALQAGETVFLYAKASELEYSNFDVATVAYSGKGTAASPYPVSTVEDLRNIGDGYYELQNDIALGEEWAPLEHCMAGTQVLDGNGHSITNLKFSDSKTYEDVGLFSLAYNTTIKNLAVEMAAGSKPTSTETAGVLAGAGKNISIKRVKVRGDMVSEGLAGGLIGSMTSGTVSECKTVGSVHSSMSSAGGIVGEIDASSSLSDSYSVTVVTGRQYIGGIVGHNLGDVSRCYATGNIESDITAGGITGCNDGASAQTFCCFAISPVVASKYNVGTAKRVVGTLTNDAPTPLNNFALQTMTVTVKSEAQDVTDHTLNGVSQSSTALMQQQTYEVNSWDFDDTWGIAENTCPYLKNIEEASDAPTSIVTPRQETLPSSGVYTLQGQKVLRQANSLGSLAAGIYIVNRKKVIVK